MANTTTTPNMGIPVPIPGTDPGPDWATNIVADMSIIDSHNHTSGQGILIPAAGIGINSDLTFAGNSATLVKSVRFSPQTANLATAADIGCLYEVSADLWYNDGAGNQVRITQGGSVTGSTGTITGLPSGTASASFSGGTFTFQSATNTPATMAVGPLVIGAATASPKTVTLGPNVAQAANYAMTFPTALPASTSFFSVTSAGAMATVVSTGANSVVLSTSPSINTPSIATPTITAGTWSGGTFTTATLTTPAISTPAFSGTPTGTITSGTYTPAQSSTVGSGAAVLGLFGYTRIGNRVTVQGKLSGTSDASGVLWISLTLPINPTGNFALVTDATGVIGCSTSAGLKVSFVEAVTGSQTVIAKSQTIPSGSSTYFIWVDFTYSCA